MPHRILERVKNYYRTLGVNSSATAEEIRRAYRVLARRYHPDLNPGKSTEDKFKEIAEAYGVLSDPKQRKSFDSEFDQAQQHAAGVKLKGYGGSFTRATERFHKAKTENFGKVRPEDSPKAGTQPHPPEAPPSADPIGSARDFFRRTLEKLTPSQPHRKGSVSKVSIIEVSLTVNEAIKGTRKTIEIAEPEGERKVSVQLPAGVRSGDVVRLRNKKSPEEDLVLVVRVASHPTLTLHSKGLVVELPITVREAMLGASITTPTLDDPVVLKVPPGSQSGTELRLRERGVTNRDGSRGDLFFRIVVRVPTAPEAVGVREAVDNLERYYEGPVRPASAKTLLDL